MNPKPISYRDLIVWQKSMDLVDETYKIVRLLPKNEYYILGSQMLRAAISVPSNISEGFRRKSKAEYGHHLSIALGSAAELETQICIVNRQYSKIDTEKSAVLVSEVQKMLNKMTINYT